MKNHASSGGGPAAQFLTTNSPIRNARLLEWEGGLYRAVRPERAAFFQRLIDEGIIASLVERKLIVPTNKASLEVPGYPLVLAHERIPFVTYPFEWPAHALRDAGILQARLNQELSQYGLTCMDAHPWNVVFNGTRPLYVDIDSITAIDRIDQGSLLDEFYGSHQLPLNLMARNQHRIARCLLRDNTTVTGHQESNFLQGANFFGEFVRLGRRLRRSFYKRVGHKPSVEVLRKRSFSAWRNAEETLAGINLKAGKTSWSDYYKNPTANEPIETTKQQSVEAALQRLKPETVLDIGANAGRYSQMAEQLGARVVASDMDESCVSQLYLNARERFPSMSSLFLNVRAPSPSGGWLGAQWPAAVDRLQADCVIALALVHHLVFSQLADFDVIADTLASFSRKQVIVEFISREDHFVSRWWNPEFGWYTLENFIEVLRKRFNRVEVLPSTPKSRSILVCEGKNA